MQYSYQQRGGWEVSLHEVLDERDPHVRVVDGLDAVADPHDQAALGAHLVHKVLAKKVCEIDVCRFQKIIFSLYLRVQGPVVGAGEKSCGSVKGATKAIALNLFLINLFKFTKKRETQVCIYLTMVSSPETRDETRSFPALAQTMVLCAPETAGPWSAVIIRHISRNLQAYGGMRRCKGKPSEHT